MKKLRITYGCLTLALLGCLGLHSQNDDILKNPYKEAQREVRQVLDEIERSVRESDMDRLISFHAYGPKFTEFKNGEPRTGPAENEHFEREFIGSFTAIEKWELDDLKIAVYDDVANVTFHADFVPYIGEEKIHMSGQFTLLFVKTDQGWKIVHEHMSPLKQEG